MTGYRGDRRTLLAWAIVFAVMLGVLALFVGLLIWALISIIDWTAVLRFIAPTAFETRSIEDIIEGWPE